MLEYLRPRFDIALVKEVKREAVHPTSSLMSDISVHKGDSHQLDHGTGSEGKNTLINPSSSRQQQVLYTIELDIQYIDSTGHLKYEE